MSTTPSVTSEALSKLRHVIEANEAVDWRAFSFGDPSLLQTLRWRGCEGEQEELIALLKAYQRLLHILPPEQEHRALPLLGVGLHSAIQIAGMPKPEFARRWAELFPGEDPLGDTVYQNAVARRSYVLLQHIHSVQKNEPHYRAARFQ
jgi:hypothetical protein